jgi:hypothetical protein
MSSCAEAQRMTARWPISLRRIRASFTQPCPRFVCLRQQLDVPGPYVERINAHRNTKARRRHFRFGATLSTPAGRRQEGGARMRTREMDLLRNDLGRGRLSRRQVLARLAAVGLSSSAAAKILALRS